MMPQAPTKANTLHYLTYQYDLTDEFAESIYNAYRKPATIVYTCPNAKILAGMIMTIAEEGDPC